MKMSSWTDNLDYAIQLNRYLLVPLGVWPISKNGPFWMKFVNKLLIVFNYFLIGFIMVPYSLHTFLEVTDVSIKLNMMGPLSFCIMVLSKYCILVSNLGTIRKCFDHIKDDWRNAMKIEKYQVIMKKKAKIGRFLITMCAIIMYGGGGLFHLIMPPVSWIFSSGASLNETSIKALAYPVYNTVINLNSNPVYGIFFIVQSMCGFIFYSTTIGSCGLAALFVMHTCGQLEIVISNLKEFLDVETSPKDTLNKTFGYIVERHLRALSFITYVEQFLNSICFVEFIGCTANICLLGYYTILALERNEMLTVVTYSILLASFTFNIFILCYIGELLTEQCRKVGEVSYTIDWYQLHGKKPLDLILVILIASSPAKITAGKMIDLSLITFSSVLKTAAAYLNILRKLID